MGVFAYTGLGCARTHREATRIPSLGSIVAERCPFPHLRHDRAQATDHRGPPVQRLPPASKQRTDHWEAHPHRRQQARATPPSARGPASPRMCSSARSAKAWGGAQHDELCGAARTDRVCSSCGKRRLGCAVSGRARQQATRLQCLLMWKPTLGERCPPRGPRAPPRPHGHHRRAREAGCAGTGGDGAAGPPRHLHRSPPPGDHERDE